MVKRTPHRGEEALLQWGSDTWGGRWPDLLAALRAPVQAVARLNPHAWPSAGPPTCATEVEALLGEPTSPWSGLSGCWTLAAARQPGPGPGPRPWYAMDPASVHAARALAVQPGDHVLDLCAAPGGKSLILADGLGDTGRLHCNEPSEGRRRRLHRVLDAWLPPALRVRVEVTGHPGERFGMLRPAGFDRVLVDAPCSSERHVLHDAAALAAWTPGRSRMLVPRQVALLCAAADAVKVGGRLVYATCSIHPAENDGVVARVLRRRPGLRQVPDPADAAGEATLCGRMLLPDRGGAGPLYWAVLERG
jgi:hypothetical protein